MGTNGSQAAARGAAFNLIVLRSRRDRDQWYSTLIPRPPPLKTYDYTRRRGKKEKKNKRSRSGEDEPDEARSVGVSLSLPPSLPLHFRLCAEILQRQFEGKKGNAAPTYNVAIKFQRIIDVY